jgi:ppGpp synthetase/RelA/SpoT-type nucleotidyltranferase
LNLGGIDVAEKDILKNAVLWYRKNIEIYQALTEVVESIIKEALNNNNIVYHSIESRTKTIESFKRKAKKEKYIDPVKEITDLTGIRVITLFEKDVYKISNIIKELFKIDYKNSEDKSDLLDADKMGYKSVHYIAKLINDRINKSELDKFENLKFEIQIRSILQHAWAEIEHDRNYKFKGELPKNIQRRFYALSGMLEMADREFNSLDDKVEEYRSKVKKISKNGQISLEINRKSLKSYLCDQFAQEIKEGYLLSEFENKDDLALIMEELNKYGIKNLIELDRIIPKNLNEILREKLSEKNDIDFSKLLRIILIINDHRKYFEQSWSQKNYKLNKVSGDIIKEYAVPLNKLLEEYDFI